MMLIAVGDHFGLIGLDVVEYEMARRAEMTIGHALKSIVLSRRDADSHSVGFRIRVII
jgi:hypothetical protein